LRAVWGLEGGVNRKGLTVEQEHGFNSGEGVPVS